MTIIFARSRMATVAQYEAANCGCDITDHDEIVELLDAASDLVHLITGGLVSGRTTMTVRPIRTLTPCGCGDCPCCTIDALPLPGVNPRVQQVKIDGAVIPAAEYRLMDGRYLIRLSTDGSTPDSWPQWQVLWRADTEDETFSIALTNGIDGESLIVSDAVVELACEIGKAFRSQPNRLPRGATAATANGATVQLRPAAEALRSGHEDLPAVMRLLGAFAPDGRSISGAYSPESGDGWEFPTFSGPS